MLGSSKNSNKIFNSKLVEYQTVWNKIKSLPQKPIISYEKYNEWVKVDYSGKTKNKRSKFGY